MVTESVNTSTQRSIDSPLTDEFATILQAKIDNKTKPPGALGRIESLAAQIAQVQATTTPCMNTCELIIFAADHGMANAGVSAFPQEVTCLLYTSPSPRDATLSRMPSSA